MSEIVAWLDAQACRTTHLRQRRRQFRHLGPSLPRYRGFGTQLAPTSGSMGYGVPAAVAAALLHPERDVRVFHRRRRFPDDRTGIRHRGRKKLKLTVILLNNNSYGTIRMHQEMHYPGRIIGTDLVNPDFAALARAYGGHGETVERTDQFADAFARARASGNRR